MIRRLLDNDTAALAITDETGDEGSDLVFTVTLDNAVQDGFEAAFSVDQGTAGADDFSVVTTGPLSFSGTAGDSRVEPDENFTVTLGAVTPVSADPGSISTGAVGTGTILDNDTAALTINDVSQDERISPMTFTVTLTGEVQGGLEVSYATADGSAKAGIDYDSASGTLIFAGTAGETQTIDVTIINNTTVESDKAFAVSLSNVTPNDSGIDSGQITLSDPATGGIIDDDHTLTVNTEGNGRIVSSPGSIDCGANCTDSFDYETDVALTPVPDPGFRFVEWSGALSGTSSPHTLTIDGDKSVTGRFTANDEICVDVDQRYNAGEWNLLGTYYFAAGEAAWVSITRIHDGDQGTSTCADAVRFSPTAGGSDIIVDNGDAGYAETGDWYDSAGTNYYGTRSRYTNTDGSAATWTPVLSEGGLYNVYAWWTTAGTRDSSATYCIHNHSDHFIDATKGGNGSMSYSVSGGADVFMDTGTIRLPVETGDSVTFNFTPDEGYIIDYVVVDGEILTGFEGESGQHTYTFPSMAMNRTFEVSFSVGEENITCIPVDQQASGFSWTYLGRFRFPGGTGAYVTLTNEGNGTVSHDAVKFSPVDGGSDIIVDDLDPESVFSHTGSNNDWETRVESQCYNGNYHFTSYAGAGVTIRPDLPAAGEYEIWVRWRSWNTRDRAAQYCVHNHMGRIIIATAGPNGILETDSGVTVESNTTQMINVLTGSSLTFTAIPDSGYVNQELIVDGAASGFTGSYTFSNIQSSRTIEAYFNDHGDNCDQATLVGCNSSTEGTITPAGDKDYFKVEFAGSGRYTFYTEGNTDTKGRLLDMFCTEITSDDHSGEVTNFNISEDLDAGTYYIEVTHGDPDNGGTGNYILNVICEHVIRATARSGGSISPEGEIVLSRGADITFNIAADSGNTIHQVKVDGYSVGDVSTYSFINVTENHTIEALFTLPPATCNDISDVPLDALTRGVPPIIMFAPDDSGSMDWEFMTPEGDGLFANKNYVFDDPGDNKYSGSILTAEQRRRWKSQWSGYNEMYYNPQTLYVPWPTLPQADPVSPRSHPYRSSPTFNLDDTYLTLQNAIVVDNTGTYDGDNIFSNDGTGGPFTASDGHWRRSAGQNWHGPDPPRSMYTTTAGAEASWIPDLPASGEYEVLVWYTTSGARDPNAPYKIVHSDGETWVERDQTQNGGTWVSLGTYDFNKDGTSSVTVRRYDNGDASHAGGTNHGDHTCADAVAFVPAAAGTIEIPNAHYYVLADDNGNGVYDDGETLYLVILDHTAQTMDYYQVLTPGDIIGIGDLLPVAEADVASSVRPRNPDGSFRTYTQERQNFANWYSFYRRRQHTSIAAISRTIYDLDNVYVGFRSINGDIKIPVKPVRVEGENEVSALLETLYEYEQVARNTPLRNGLRYVGQYLDQDDSNNGGMGTGVPSPWKGLEEGGECQQAFAILMTDGFWNGPDPGVGNVDGDKGSPYADTYSNTLADVAMLYHQKDLVPDLPDEVPANPFDDATHQHMVTYGVSFGVTGTLDPDYNPATGSPYDVRSGDTEDHPTWPNPTSGSQQKIDDLWHASVNGRGAFLSASNPDRLIQSLLDIMQNIQARTGSASSVSINGDQLYGTIGEDVRVFQASYSSGTMSGDVKSYQLDQETGEVLTEDPVWAAAQLLDTRVSSLGHQDRIIVTRDLASGGGGIPFTHTAISLNGTTEQLEYLTPDWSASAAATTENLINYLRGEQTHELRQAGPFRDRTSRLGDIVHSSPYYHNNMLYVGANDGMLHALDAATGKELFAYVPGLVYENLKEYCDPAYNHKFYVDLTPFAKRNVDFGGTQKTVLVGGLGKGGKGYYALDITGLSGASSFTGMTESAMADRVLWEFPDVGADAGIVNDMGYTYSKAYIVKSNDTANAPWIVVFGNGYNSENSSAVLFVLDPTDGSLITRIDTGVTNCNGLSSPALLDVNFDDKVDYVYAGDLQGNIWKFDLTSSDFNDWAVAYADADDVPQPLFQAQGPAGSLQPITIEPEIMPHCGYPDLPGFMIVFGTGKYLGASDFLDTSTQSIYGIWDYGDDDDQSEYLGAFMRSHTPRLSNQEDSVTLLEQVFNQHTLTIDVDTNGDGVLDGTEEMTFRVLTGNIPDWSVTTTPDDGTSCGDFPESDLHCDPNGIGDSPDPLADAGWYADFIDSGERMISSPLIRLGLLSYITFVPQESPCGGEGYSFPTLANACTGGNYGEAVFDISQDRIIDEHDLIDIGDENDPVLVAPSSRKFTGRLQPPAIVRMPGGYGMSRDKYFMSSSLGEIVTQTVKSPRIGIIYWKDMMHD